MSSDTHDPQDSWGVDTKDYGTKNLTRGGNFDGTVEKAYFTTDANYNQGQSLLLRLATKVDKVYAEEDDLFWPAEQGGDPIPGSDLEGEVINVDLPVGKGWITEDDGVTAVNERGTTMFHASSIMGRIVGNMIGELDGFGDKGTTVTPVDHEDTIDLVPAGKVLRERGQATEASVWKGLSLAFRGFEFDHGVNRKTQEKMVSERSLPVALISEGKAKAGGAKKAAKKASSGTSAADKIAAKKAAAKKAEVEEETTEATDSDTPIYETVAEQFGFDPELEVKDEVLKALEDAEDHGAFVEAVLEIESAFEDDALMAAVADEESGLWSIKA